MVYAVAKGKFPKKPPEGNILESCWRDFRDFRRKDNNQINRFLSMFVRDLENRGTPNALIEQQLDNLAGVRLLIFEGKDQEAFSLFHQTLPYCMPHRSPTFRR